VEKLQELHSQIRKCKYFYYEKHKSIISDYEFDMIEIEYVKLCDKFNVPQEQRVTNFVGFSIMIPIRLEEN
jgi:NAD-dependent DNA ligase